MHNIYQWEIAPISWPAVVRSCPKCGHSSEYECSGNFRVNANHNTIDVWLIYQCNKCNNTWNMDILSRTNVKSMNKELYHKFLSNDRELAGYYAFDAATLSRNKATANYENINYDVIGDTLMYHELTQKCQIDIQCPYPFPLRLDRLLVRQLGLSREHIKALSDRGKIVSTDGKNISKIKMKNNLRLILKP